ncbi:MAG: SAM-dependent DNA methyltransferase, partial [Pseudomonadota bacterium]
PPWGKGSVTKQSQEWADRAGWEASYKDIGPLFLPKAAALTRQHGSISILQPAKSLLFNRSGPIKRFRTHLFTTFKVEEVTNLAAVRFHHFDTSDSPVCIISFRPKPPDGEPLTYICPKPSKTTYDKNLIIIDPQDVNTVLPQEAAKDQLVWTALMWGGRRDVSLLTSLKRFRRLLDYVDSGQMHARGRVIRGKQEKLVQPEILDRRILTSEKQIENCLFHIDAESLPLNKDTSTHRRFTNLLAFNVPQLILKQSWTVRDGRFRALMVNPDASGSGIVTTLSYVSVHASQELEPVLETACMIYNSIFAVYYLLLTSGRFAVERPTILDQETLYVPLPELGSDLLKGLNSLGDVDSTVRSLFAFSEVEWALIEDMTKYTVPSAKSKVSYPYDPTSRENTGYSEMRLYGEFFLKVLKAGFGEDKSITYVPFVEAPSQKRLPVRLVAFYLESPLETEYKIEEINSEDLYRRLGLLHRNLMDLGSSSSGGIFFQRIARIYDVTNIDGQRVPVVYIIKPDQVRYWTRSMALRDADEVAADIMGWASSDSRSGSDKEGTGESTAYPL